MTAQVQSLLNQLALEEKAALCTGATPWQTLPVERLGLLPITVSDGPHGVRRSVDVNSLITGSKPATCFPVAAALSATWNPDLLYELGQALAEECIALDVDILLGPGVNIKRTPLCGRNFEYFSEDPLLAGELAARMIQGIQSRGVGTSLKHYAVNNQETRRFTVSAEIDERTLHEIYLPAFETAVKKGKPWTVMAAYNRVNGEYCTQNADLLTDILRDQWGFEGFVVSDWGAVRDRVAALRAGLDLQMPGSVPHSILAVIEAVQNGTLDEALLNRAVERILNVIFCAHQTPKGGTFDVDAHHALARRIATETIVLLKNDGNLLPLSGNETLAVIGQAAQVPVYQGGGSSHVNSTRADIPIELLQTQAEVRYVPGDGPVDVVDQTLIQEAVAGARQADVAVLFIALPAVIESEGYDRQDLSLTPHQNALIQAVAAVQPRTVVVLNNGSAITMHPWIDAVPAVLEAWLPGQAGAGAITDVLFGVVNPSGKLAETFPLSLSDTPAYLNFPGENGKVCYGEGVFVGYRYYDATQRVVLFPFGHGLSYTRFGYSNLRVSKTDFIFNETLEVAVDITNLGQRAGQEIVQVYVCDPESRLRRPPKELKAFAKVALEPGETKTVQFQLEPRAFSYYNPAYGRWVAEAGDFEILVGSSSAAIHLRQTVKLVQGTALPSLLNEDSTVGDWLEDPRGAALIQPMLSGLFGQGDGASAPEMLGSDPFAMFRDLLLSTMLEFQPPSNGATPQQIIAGLLTQVRASS